MLELSMHLDTSLPRLRETSGLERDKSRCLYMIGMQRALHSCETRDGTLGVDKWTKCDQLRDYDCW
jgi:hypothetical protein